MRHLSTVRRAVHWAAGCTALAVALSTPLAASAQSFDFQGLFFRDDQHQTFRFEVTAAGNVTVRSYGYGGGTTPSGLVVNRGGFDTILSVFSADGAFVADNDDGGSGEVDATTGVAFDAGLVIDLTPGTYFAALTQADNYAAGNFLGDGFARTGDGNYTNRADFDFTDPCSSGRFRDLSGSDGRCRTGRYAVSFFGSVAAAGALPVQVIPEPATALLLAPALAGVALWRRKHGGALINQAPPCRLTKTRIAFDRAADMGSRLRGNDT